LIDGIATLEDQLKPSRSIYEYGCIAIFLLLVIVGLLMIKKRMRKQDPGINAIVSLQKNLWFSKASTSD
jgi:hypothetical protein